MKICPLTKQRCNPNCAWYHTFEDTGDTDCSVKVLADVAVAEFNAYFEENELQDNLHKEKDTTLPN